MYIIQLKWRKIKMALDVETIIADLKEATVLEINDLVQQLKKNLE